MFDRFRNIAYGMTGFSGAMLMWTLVLLVACGMPLPERVDRLLFGLSLNLLGGAILFAWTSFPRMRLELDGNGGFQIWFWSIFGSLLLLSLGDPDLAFWRDLARAASMVASGRVIEVAGPSPPAGLSRLLQWAGFVTAIGSIVYGWRRFKGFDRVVLVGLSVGDSLYILRIVSPETAELLCLIIGWFIISLSWSGPIGPTAQGFLQTILSYFRRRPASPAPTSIEVPVKGTDISKL